MSSLSALLAGSPFSLRRPDKAALFAQALSALTRHHRDHCPAYARILDRIGCRDDSFDRIEDLPFIPVRLFKDYELRSVELDRVVKTMTSSGTSGQRPSRIFLDKDTAANQTKVLARLVSDFIGTKRLPMLIVDSRATVKDRALFSARGAGILGFSIFGSGVEYALDDRMQLDAPLVTEFATRHGGGPVLLFGFTSIIWEHFLKPLQRGEASFAFPQGTLIHGGGWKKLIDQAVTSDVFKRSIAAASGIGRVCNYYGMVEQTGSIFMECEFGHLHASDFSDIVIRDHRDFSPLPLGEPGLIQLLSLLPASYPGHSILTEDEGRIIGEDDCPCGRFGKYVEIRGRVKNAEIRGCSDAYTAAG